MSPAESVSEEYLLVVREQFNQQREAAQKAIAQISDTSLLLRPVAEGQNSVAVIVKHLGGNLRSRFTDFIVADGEKPWRDRDSEFEVSGSDSWNEIWKLWEQGWGELESVLGGLSENYLLHEVTIRGEKHTILKALNRSLSHVSYHVGQITFLCKLASGDSWKSLSIPRGGSAEFTATMAAKLAKR